MNWEHKRLPARASVRGPVELLDRNSHCHEAVGFAKELNCDRAEAKAEGAWAGQLLQPVLGAISGSVDAELGALGRGIYVDQRRPSHRWIDEVERHWIA